MSYRLHISKKSSIFARSFAVFSDLVKIALKYSKNGHCAGLIGTLLIIFVASLNAAEERPYLCELGLQGGCGYYAGDSDPHIFNHPRETFGAHFRYKFDYRWALQVKGLYQRTQGSMPTEINSGLWTNKMINMDVMGEFNFFRFGGKVYDKRVRPYTPYIFLGIGLGLYGQNFHTAACYVPVGIGFKWKFSRHCGLNIAWQHNIYMADDLEGIDAWGNTYHMNGANIMNMDVTGQFTFGIVFEFIQTKKICRNCNF